MTLEQIIKEIGLTKEQLETVIDTYNHKNLNDILNEQVKYIKIVEDIKEGLSKVLFTKEVSDIGLANEDMNKGAIIAYQDIYNRISELENDELREDSIS